MTHLTTAKINRAIAKAGIANIELAKGEGYFYLILDTAALYETRSIMVPYLGDMALDRWVDEARDFAADFATA